MINQKGKERASLDYSSHQTLADSESGANEIDMDEEEGILDEERSCVKPLLKQKGLTEQL